MNVHDDAAAQAEMERLGIPLVPATVVGERFVHGWKPAALAALVGVAFDDTPALTPRELAQALDNVLYYNQHLLVRLSAAQLEIRHPRRNRTLRDLAFHVFRLSAAFVDAMEQDGLQKGWLEEGAPADLQDAQAIADYGRGVRERIAAWFERAPDDVFAGAVRTYYGDQPAHQLLERTCWHAGQHLRQVYDLLEADGSLPVPPLAAELFEGLPMPAELW